MIEHRCGKCGKWLESPDRLAGQIRRCTECSAMTRVPSPGVGDLSEPGEPGESREPVEQLELADTDPRPQRPTRRSMEPDARSRETVNCPYCGGRVLAIARKCRHCKKFLDDDGSDDRDREDDRGMGMILPMNQSVWAIVSGYLGLISVLLLPAPFALITGILAIQEMKRKPKKRGMPRAVFGIVMGSLGTIGIIMLVIVGLMK